MKKEVTKSALKSKTIIFNVLTVLIVIATFMGYTPNQELAELVSQILIGLAPLINIVLRFVTKEPISIK